MTNRILLSLFAVLLTFSLATVRADPSGIADQMTNMFDTMMNYTNPTVHLGQRRGVVTGGSLSARNRIASESLWHFVPPSYSAGWGGIDLFAGSFSFISADQFQNLLRAIAANAAPVIAVEMTQVILTDMLRAVETASALDNHAHAKQLLAQIDGARAQLYRQYEVVSDRDGDAQTLLEASTRASPETRRKSTTMMC